MGQLDEMASERTGRMVVGFTTELCVVKVNSRLLVETLVKNNRLLIYHVCNKILNAEFKRDNYFVDEVETQLREKPLQGSQTQDIHYS